jgi:hypothetical protein
MVGDAAVVVPASVASQVPSVAARPIEVPVEVPMPPVAETPARLRSSAPSKWSKEVGGEPRAAGMRVPSTAATVSEWASLWVKMCSGPDSGLGPLNDDDVRARYGLTAKQLRNVRHAATSGVLR